MAIDANILLQGRGPDAVGAIQGGYALGQGIQQAPIRNRLLNAQIDQQEQQNQQAAQEAEIQQYKFQIQDLATDWGKIKPLLQSGDTTRANVALAERIQKIQARGGDPSDTMAFRDALNSGQVTPQQLIAELDGELEGARSAGLLGRNGGSASQAFDYLTRGLTPEQQQEARMIELGLKPRAGTITGQERVATTPGMTGAVASSESAIAGAKAGAQESAKLGKQMTLLPGVRSAIKEAEAAAAAKGETLTELGRAKAAMPGLIEVSDKLKKLSDVATYTTAGKVVDTAAKELGFGATEGATARASMTSIVDNQVLPLLRDTFGAAFTAAEGERLRAALLDPDASPEQKKATLDAFTEQKYRNIETKERELGLKPSQQPKKTGGQLMIDANGNRAMVYPDGSFEEVR